MLVVPELEREVEFLWEIRDNRKVLITYGLFPILLTDRRN